MSAKTLIYICGMMGVGKSTFGRSLAQALGYKFIDLDAEIVKQEGKSISEIFIEKGEDYFRAIEHDLLKTTLEKRKLVVSLGGGTPCYFNNMELIKKFGFSVYLQAEINFLFSRLRSKTTKRPVLGGVKEGDLKDFLQKMLNERESFYKLADTCLDVPGKSPKALITQAIEAIEGFGN